MKSSCGAGGVQPGRGQGRADRIAAQDPGARVALRQGAVDPGDGLIRQPDRDGDGGDVLLASGAGCVLAAAGLDAADCDAQPVRVLAEHQRVSRRDDYIGDVDRRRRIVGRADVGPDAAGGLFGIGLHDKVTRTVAGAHVEVAHPAGEIQPVVDVLAVERARVQFSDIAIGGVVAVAADHVRRKVLHAHRTGLPAGRPAVIRVCRDQAKAGHRTLLGAVPRAPLVFDAARPQGAVGCRPQGITNRQQAAEQQDLQPGARPVEQVEMLIEGNNPVHRRLRGVRSGR